jgi:hypothetical protein
VARAVVAECDNLLVLLRKVGEGGFGKPCLGEAQLAEGGVLDEGEVRKPPLPARELRVYQLELFERTIAERHAQHRQPCVSSVGDRAAQARVVPQ